MGHEELTTAIYCFLDAFFLIVGSKDDAHCKLSNTALLTAALLAARYFHRNLHPAAAMCGGTTGCG